MSKRTTVFVGAPKALNHIVEWCRAIYHTTFGLEEGEKRFLRLRFVDALALYEAGEGEPLVK